MCPRYVDFEGFSMLLWTVYSNFVYFKGCIALFGRKKYDFKIRLLSNQDGASVCEQWRFCWKIKYFGLFNINFIRLQSVWGLESMGKIKINVQNTAIQGFYAKFWKNLPFVNVLELMQADELIVLFCFIMKQTMNKNASGPIEIHTFSSS